MPHTFTPEERLKGRLARRVDRATERHVDTALGTWVIVKDCPPGVGWVLTPPVAPKGYVLKDPTGSIIRPLYYSTPDQCKEVALTAKLVPRGEQE